jgi:hypothetical protein
MNWARKMVTANAKSYRDAKKAMLPSRAPIPTPKKQAAPTSVRNHPWYLEGVT